MTTLDEALLQFSQLFERMGIPYAVMGGLAVRVHGIPRPTHDVDVTIAIDRAQLSELYDGAEELGFTVPEAFRKGWVDDVAGMPLVKLRMYLERHGIDIDLFLAESPFQAELLSRRQRLEWDDHHVWIVSPEDLVLLKLLANRARDIADIGDILFTQGTLDETYMRRWADVLGVRERLERVLEDVPD
jgi:hypothetical protein